MMMRTIDSPSLLDTIVAATRRIVELRAATMPRGALECQARDQRPRGDRFFDALASTGTTNVIAECKRRSPSAGVLRPAYDPVVIARAYEAAGAVAVSVLTEPTFFDGSLDHLAAVRSAVDVPVLRKDFVIDSYQVVEAVAAGADAILLIVAALEQLELKDLLDEAQHVGLAVLVEVHDAEELRRAVDAGARFIGVNNRNLRTLDVSLSVAAELIPLVPARALAVAESGLRTGDDLASLRQAGYAAFLIGERFMTVPDPGAALATLLASANGSPPNLPVERP